MTATPKEFSVRSIDGLPIAEPLQRLCLARVATGDRAAVIDLVPCDAVLLLTALHTVHAKSPNDWRQLSPDALDAYGALVARLPASHDDTVLSPFTEWRHAYGCAVGAQRLLEWLGEPDTDLAYLGGLVHDIGRWLLFQADPGNLGQIYIQRNGRQACSHEIRAFGFDHGEAGARALETWSIPAPLPDLVRYHHSGPPEGHPHAKAISAVLISNRLAELFYSEPAGERTNLFEIERAARRLLGISPQVLEEVLVGMISAVQETATGLGLEASEPMEHIRRLVETNLKISRIHLSLERSNRTLEGRLEQLRLLGEVSELINREKDTEILFNSLVERIARIVRAERVSMFLRVDTAQGDGEMVLVAGRGMPPEATATAPVLDGHGISGYVAESGAAIMVHDLATDERFAPSDGTAGERTGSFISVPINVGDRTVGLIHVGDRVGNGAFGDDDTELLTTIAHQLSISLETQRLLRTLAERNQRLQEANRTITESTRALERERNKLSSILWSMGEGVVVCNADRQIILVNNAAEAILNKEAARLLGRDLAASGSAALEVAANRLGRLSVEGAGRNLDETTTIEGRTIRFNLATIDDPDGKFLGTVVVLQDTTRLLEAEKARNEFVYHVSHELRTPLVSINGFASTILRDPEMDSATREEFLQIIVSEGTRLTRLIDNLLEFSKVEQGRLALNQESCDLPQLVQLSTGGLTKPAEDKQIKIVVDIDSRLPRVLVDEDRTRQVLVNLLANAVKFSPAGSEVVVQAHAQENNVLVTVTDHGPGIAPELRHKVFDRFFQVRRDGAATQGTGLGLAIVQEIVHAHGGHVWIEEVEGGGTRVCFTLPALASDPG
ncbi:MAG: ATP-binding protein [Nitrospirota bacterium]|jgi:two-component system phosphate regulon sensor histidine kinase PhoR